MTGRAAEPKLWSVAGEGTMTTDENGLEVLSRAEAITLLESQEAGRLVYTRRALPAVRPVNFVVRGGAVLIWTGSQGTDIAVISAFTVCALIGGALTLRRRTP